MKPARGIDALPSAEALLKVIHHHQEQVLAAIQSTGMTSSLARSLHDLALASTVFGHLPPIRLLCIRSLMHPSYDGPCEHSGCVHGPSCHGNQLEKTGGHGLHMQLPHHKNEANWGGASIAFTLPQELAFIMQLHLSQGHQLLTDYIGREGEFHVFVDKQGRPFTDSNFTIYWDKMMHAMGLTPAISPSLCRQVFVHERRSVGRADGPSDKGAAMVMGHSLQQWTKWYDLDFHKREAQAAVDAMTAWRHKLLAASPIQVQPPEPQKQTVQPLNAQHPAPSISLAIHPTATQGAQGHAMEKDGGDADGDDDGIMDDEAEDDDGPFHEEEEEEECWNSAFHADAAFDDDAAAAASACDAHCAHDDDVEVYISDEG